MSKSKPNWLSGLTIPGFGERSEAKITGADPVTPTEMRVAVDDILEYENNPRRAVNAKLDEIRLSILQRGFEGTLDITRRPGEKFYIPLRGGNTTLACIKEIYRETENPHLGIIRCLFHPWVSELNTRLNHLIENDIRGDLIFIDRSLAVMEAWEELNSDAGAELSQSKLSVILRNQGYKIDQTMISRMQYAVQKLRPCIPVALDAGLGFHSVVRIRQLEKAFEDYLTYRGLGVEVRTVAEAWFFNTLATHDGEQWEIKPMIDVVIEKSAALTDSPPRRVRQEVETLLAGGMKALEAKSRDLEASVQIALNGEQEHFRQDVPLLTDVMVETSASEQAASVRETNGVEPAASETVQDARDTHPSSESVDTVDETSVDEQTVRAEATVADSELSVSKTDGVSNFPSNAEKLKQTDLSAETNRQRNLVFESTTMLIESIGLGECFSPALTNSLLILDLPEIPIDLASGDIRDRKKAALWWLLAHLFGQFEMDPEALFAHIPPEYRLSLMGQCMGNLEDGQAAWVSYCGQWVGVPTLETVIRDLLLRLNETELVLLFKILRGLGGISTSGQRS